MQCPLPGFLARSKTNRAVQPLKISRDLKFWIVLRYLGTKDLISYAVTTELICAHVFAYAKSRFSHDAAHIQKAFQ